MSGLSQKHLSDGEEILAEVRKFFGKVVSSIIIFVIFIAVLVTIIWFLPSSTPRFVGYIFLVLAIFALIWLVSKYLRWRTYILTVTNRRIVESDGFLKRAVREVPVNKIQAVNLNQGLIERAFKVGDLEITSGAFKEGSIVYSSLPHCETLFHLISQLIDENR